MTIRIRIADGLEYLHTSKSSRLSNTMDPDPGTITIWSTFENPGHILQPGMRVTVISDIDEAALERQRDQ